jgi:hypothetical protein
MLLIMATGTAWRRYAASPKCAGAGATELLTSYVPDDGGPAAFDERLGFVPIGEFDGNGEVIARLRLTSLADAVGCRASIGRSSAI